MISDPQVMLDAMQLQLRWLEQEILVLRQTLEQPTISPAPRSFESLRGIWENVVFDAEDFTASRLKLPEGL